MTDGIKYVDMTVNGLADLRDEEAELPSYIRLANVVASGVVHGNVKSPLNFNYSCFLRDDVSEPTEGPFLMVAGYASARKATVITHSAETGDILGVVEGLLENGGHDHFYLNIDNISLDGLIE